jgi:hypothetical protein
MIWTRSRKIANVAAVRNQSAIRLEDSPVTTSDRLEPTSSRRSTRDVAVILAALVAGIIVAAFTGCQTPAQQTFAGTVPPPATHAIGQPAPYASYVSMPQGAAYPPGAPLPGPAMTAPAVAAPPAMAPSAMAPPASTWQSAVPTQPPMIGSPAAATSPAPSTWSWSQTGNPTAQPSLQQYGAQLQDQAGQLQQGLASQGQQAANQLQSTANQYQQQLANQWSQLTTQQQQQLAGQMQNAANQMQGSVNQYGQQFNAAVQQANTQAQQAAQQAWPSQPTQQTANGSWWPFNSPSSVPPARATPAMPTKY